MIKITVVADFHLEKLEFNDAINELNNFFIPTIKKTKPDILVINGDLFDNKLSVNSKYFRIINGFIHELSKMDIVILLVHGTLYHEHFQILSFSHLVNDKFKIFINKSVFRYKNLKFLILPEEYNVNKKEYYKDELYSNEKYDFVFGHGVIDFIGFVDHISKIKKQSIFTYDDFKDKVYGRVIFGHYHRKCSYKDLLMYIGSFSRFSFGEEEDKGFSTFIYDEKNKKLKEEIFHKNILAKKYQTIHYKDINNNTIKYLNDELKNTDYLRILLEKDKDIEKFNDIMSFVHNNNNVFVKFIVNKNKIITFNKKRTNINKYKNKHWLDITVKEINKKEFDRQKILKMLE